MEGSWPLILALCALAALALVALVLVARAWQRERRLAQARIEQLLSDHEKGVLDARRESLQKSRSSLKGQIAEQMAPLLPGFLYLPADARFLGDPVDYVVFSGYTDVRDSSGPDSSALDIVLLEVKQGTSSLSPYQRAIARSVEEGRVRFEVLRIAEDGRLSTEAWRPRKKGESAR
jgi:predicted Holliday junction resolvase-like endonuclease